MLRQLVLAGTLPRLLPLGARCFHATLLRRAAAAPPAATATTAALPARPTSTRRIITTLLAYVWPVGHPFLRARVVVALGLLVGAKVLNIQVPFLFKRLADELEGRGHQQPGGDGGGGGSSAPPAPARRRTLEEAWVAIPLAVLLSYGLARSTSSLFTELRNALFARVAQRAIRVVSRDVFRHLLRLDQQYHLSRPTGTMQRVMDRGSRSINFVLTALVFNVVPTALEIALVAGIFAHQCGTEYAAVTLATLATYVGYTMRVTSWRDGIRKELNKLETEAAALSLDGLLNAEAVKSFCNEEAEVARYDAALAAVDGAALRTQTSLSMLNFGQNAIFSVGLTAAMALASRDIAAGTMTLGDLILVNGLLFQLSIPLNFVGMVYRELRQGLTDMEAMFTVLGTAPRVADAPGAAPLWLPLRAGGAAAAAVAAAIAAPPLPLPPPPAFDAAAALRFHNVHFAYGDRPVLRGLTFEVAAGTTVGVVGPSGCGKSTLARLLTRLYDVAPSPAGGAILVHGQDVRSVTLASLRGALCVVPQETTLFNATVAHNIADGAPGGAAGAAEVEAAARAAALHGAVATWPAGYATRVGERGLKLSGGEKQRVAVARALLRDAPILVCDEATSALDSHTEAAVLKELLRGGRTTLFIAHRLSTVMRADKIVVLEGGVVVEEGAHAQLLEAGGLYRKLWEKQRKEEIEVGKTKAPV